jgi:hypothetical protein
MAEKVTYVTKNDDGSGYSTYEIQRGLVLFKDYLKQQAQQMTIPICHSSPAFK